MKEKRTALFAWIAFGVIASSNLASSLYFYLVKPSGKAPSLFELIFPLVPVLFALVGALITANQPRNVIGLIMMIPGASFAFVVDAYMAPWISGFQSVPQNPSILFIMIVWFSNWNWLLLILPILFIMLLFPTGRPLSLRWKWAVRLGQGIFLFMVLVITFSQEISPNVEPIPWSVQNPIGFIPMGWVNIAVTPFFIIFPVWILICVVSLFLRFRRAGAEEREQIKWLFYAAAVFVVLYMPSFIGNTYYDYENTLNLLLPIGMATFPIAIGMAILRYRLYDIDIIIRKTLQYAILTGLLALVYFGSVILLQSLTEKLFREQSQLVIVLSTLAIAALFNPLRNRIQDFIDRRFYRKKYDAEQALAQFAATARNEVDMEKLTGALLRVVEETVQPRKVSLWLKKGKNHE